jgi:excisionase family DNA binding protein
MKQRPTLITGKITDGTDKLLTVAEVSELCQCSDKKVKEWLKDGRLAHIVLGDGKDYPTMIRIRESALITFWKQAERKAIP